MESEVAATATATAAPVRKRLSESMKEVAGDGSEMIGISNTKRAKPEVAVVDGGMGSGVIIGLPRTKGRVGFSGVTVIELPKTKGWVGSSGDTIIELPKAKPAEILNRRMIDFEKSTLKQFKTKGYAVYARGVEVTDDEDEDDLLWCDG